MKESFIFGTLKRDFVFKVTYWPIDSMTIYAGRFTKRDI